MTNNTEAARADAGDSFEPLGLTSPLTEALARLNLDAPTDIQRALIPAILAGRDCLACATTGVGKTNVYLLPILQHTRAESGLHALVIQPTRSLAMRLQRNIGRFAPQCEPTITLATGGREARSHADPLEDDPDLIIATPRGAADLVRFDGFDWSTLPLLVIDEFDAILDDRGGRHLERVREALGRKHQTVLITGHLDDDLRAAAEQFLSDPVEFEAQPPAPRALSAQQTYIEVTSATKLDTLIAWCKRESPKLALVFAANERRGRELASKLGSARISCRWESERRQRGPRDDPRRREPRHHSQLIVAADPASSRLSTIPATHLVHYDLPLDVDTYVHRLETASRLRKNGCAVVFVEPKQHELLPEIVQRTGVSLTEVVLEPDERPLPRRDSGTGPPRREDRAAPAPPTVRGHGRLNKLLYADPELDARGVAPPRRTLGAHFCTARRNKPLRRPT